MRYVIFRDDDTNAFTPVECLERLYRPFLERGLPVNLATIPEVATDAKMKNGEPEGFLRFREQLTGELSNNPMGQGRATVPIGSNRKLIDYLRDNPGYCIVQHGCHHDYLEFDRPEREEIASRLDNGTQRLREAGFPQPRTFVAPYDKLSRAAMCEVSRRFSIVSTGWFELRRLPYSWWPRYAVKKVRHEPHWKAGGALLLSHPGCLLSCHRTSTSALNDILRFLETQPLTVLVTHWWEYFREGVPDEEFIGTLHDIAHYVALHPELKAISFADLVGSEPPLN